ncbi:hypothetical protein CRG98_016460 [Punica granatum]|uniref:Uncharacterized protein n=1 Tax=Punica granatum TaxID=22663 RepID=A0A2I0K3J8_PUNGR|nr:hypothetical protein CRG98_016460 [Punica granatum]
MLGCKGCTFGCARTSGALAGTRGRARARGALSWQARGRARGAQLAGVRARGSVRLRVTVHMRARSSPEMRKST